MSNMLSEMLKTMALLKESIGTSNPFILAFSKYVLITDEQKEAALNAFKEARTYFD
jgi:hypothetical protein